ncbi:MAG: response regulator transcription factor [Bacteroidota bacterium]
MESVRVLLADDHPLLREGIRRILEREPDIQVVGEARNGAEALKLARTVPADVLLLDMEMPKLTGVEVARRLRSEQSTVRVLALSAYDDAAYVSELLRNDAYGYITKGKAPMLVVEAVQAVANGERRWFVNPSSNDHDQLPISEREQEVLTLMAQGHSNKQIAEQLFISDHTVRNHIANIYSKLGVSSWREAIAWAWQQGLMSN